MNIFKRIEYIKRLKDMNIYVEFGVKLLPLFYLRAIVEAIEEVADKAPIIREKICFLFLKKIKYETIAMASSWKGKYSISFNNLRCFSIFLKEDLKRSFYDKYRSTSTIKGTIFHEIGHICVWISVLKLINATSCDSKDFLNDFKEYKKIKEILKEFGIDEDDYKSFSYYSGKNAEEAFCEIFSAVMTGEIYDLDISDDLKESAKNVCNYIFEILNS